MKLMLVESLHFAVVPDGDVSSKYRVVTPALSVVVHAPPSECRYSLALGFGVIVAPKREARVVES